MKKGFKILLGLVLLICLLAVGGLILMRAQANASLASLPFATVDMRAATDGVYEGAADAGLVTVRVSVTVEDGRIAGIDLLEHRNGMGSKAEAILSDMIAANDWNVDAVTGATLSSQTIKSAVSDALLKSTTV